MTCNAKCSTHLHRLLKQVTPSASFSSINPAHDLDRMTDIWNLNRANQNLTETNNANYSRISKFLPQKRPGLVPVIDNVTRARVVLSVC